MNKAVIGILAHVDAGKTTLSEALLYQTGQIRKLGRVDHQDSFLDQENQERQRGITIFSKQARMIFPNWDITLLDTPGHVDFSSEMERTLQVLDYAVLVISGADGVQSHTKTLWKLLQRYHIPTFVFINKMDLHQMSKEDIISDLNTHLAQGFVDMGQEDDLIKETIAAFDEGAMEDFFETGTVSDPKIASLIQQRILFPCYFGSALKIYGIDELIRGIDRYMVRSTYPEAFGARVYKIGRDGQGERLTYLKLTGGILKVKDQIAGRTGGNDWNQKVNQIRLYSGAKYTTVETAEPGMILALTGLSETYAGEGLGFEIDSKEPVLDSFLSFQVFPEDGQDIHTIHQKMRILEEEDPTLHLVWDPQMQKLHIQLMGEVQLEVLERLMEERFHIKVSFGPGNIVYRETIAHPVEGVGHYEPLRHYAEVHLLMEPAPRGSGISIQSKVREDVLNKSYQHLILTHLAEKTHLGVLTGSPITDMVISIVGGAGSVVHTVGGDFRESTYRAVRQGLMEAESVLLEPWYDFELTLPNAYVGRAATDLEMLFATFEIDSSGAQTVIKGKAPASTMMGYQVTLSSYTKGEGMLLLMPRGYEECHNTNEVVMSLHYDPEEDLMNPAGSIFCAHGAGFFVPWYQVPSYMHLETNYSYLHPKRSLPQGGQTTSYLPDPASLDTGKDEEETSSTRTDPRPKKSTVGSVHTLEEDKELMAIFERTYGKVKETAFHPVEKKKQEKKDPETQERLEKKRQKQTQTAKTQYLLVDGYNILFAFDSLKTLAKENIDLARTRLMDLLSAYQSLKGCTLILVFDAYNVIREKEDVIKYHNIYVVYTKQAETADTYIERATYELLPNHIVRVATSDGAEQMIVLGHGALRVSAREFEQELNEVREEMDRILLAWNRSEKNKLTHSIEMSQLDEVTNKTND